ncbi:MAG: VOC family protein [Deltaproteobacteria bacterium]|nr:VOC family protein [Deltaproteobacteria bacterium]
MALAVHHLAVVVSDLQRAERFYVGVLGLTVIRRWHDELGNERSTWLGLAGDAFLAVERGPSQGPKRPDDAPGWHCVALGIDACERAAWRDRLCAAGFPVERESPYTLYTRDPDGNLVALSHYPAPHAIEEC